MSAPGGLRYDRYLHDGRAEWLMRIGPPAGRPVLIVPPLFEEMNRTRALIAATMRALAGNGLLCVLPDLPGTGESERELADCSWQDWTGAVRAVADTLGPDLLIVSVRGGALLDGVPARGHWRLSPADGSSLARDLARSGLVGGDGGAGYSPSSGLLAELAGAAPAELPTARTVRLTSDPRPADRKLAGPALWRRSEPASSSELTELITSDIGNWSTMCAAS